MSKHCEHLHPLKIYEQSPNFPPPTKKNEKQQQQQKKNHQRFFSPKNPTSTPKQSLAVENRHRLAGQKNPVLRSPSFNCSESLFSKPQLVMQGWEHQMSPQHRLYFLQEETEPNDKNLLTQISQCSSYFVSQYSLFQLHLELNKKQRTDLDRYFSELIIQRHLPINDWANISGQYIFPNKPCR